MFVNLTLALLNIMVCSTPLRFFVRWGRMGLAFPVDWWGMCGSRSAGFSADLDPHCSQI